MPPLKAIIIPGNGGATPQDEWYPYVARELVALGVTAINEQFPDAVLAREEYWLPFVKTLGADENTVLIGHSSGAIAAMRFAEKNKIFGSVLVGAYYTDMGEEMERKSGYFNRPWDWQAIKGNQQWIIQFASTDDPFIPIEEARAVSDFLGTEYYEFSNQQHFGNGEALKIEFPELIQAVMRKIL